MTLSELRSVCADNEGDFVSLFLPPPNGNGYTRRLAGKKGPLGEIVCGTQRGQVVRFSTKAVLRFLNKMEEKQ